MKKASKPGNEGTFQGKYMESTQRREQKRQENQKIRVLFRKNVGKVPKEERKKAGKSKNEGIILRKAEKVPTGKEERCPAKIRRDRRIIWIRFQGRKKVSAGNVMTPER